MYNYKQLREDQVEYVQVAEEGELENGGRLFIEIDRMAIVIFNIAGGLFAIGDVCTHDDGPLGDGEVVDHAVICPRHGARFDIQTGKVLSLPAIVDIPAYPVRVVDGMIEIGIPVES